MNIRLAKQSDLQTLNQILVQAAERIASMGSSQWCELLASDVEAIILPRILKQHVYVGELDNKVVIMAFVMPEEEWDKSLWYQFKSSNEALYLHKLAIKPGYEGQGIAQSFLNRLESELVNSAKISVLRLDCMKEKMGLNALYQRAGFNYVGTYQGEITNNTEFNLYEKTMKTSC